MIELTAIAAAGLLWAGGESLLVGGESLLTAPGQALLAGVSSLLAGGPHSVLAGGAAPEVLLQGILTDPFPNGIERYAVGGLLVGLGTAVIYLGTGIIAGASTFLESTLSYVSSREQFHQFRASRDWRVVFTVGIVGGAAVYALLFQGGVWMTDVQWWRLLGGGVLVGIGTRLGKGCTSGHGVCGVGSASVTSIANVITFIAVAVGTALLIQTLGVTP